MKRPKVQTGNRTAWSRCGTREEKWILNEPDLQQKSGTRTWLLLERDTKTCDVPIILKKSKSSIISSTAHL